MSFDILITKWGRPLAFLMITHSSLFLPPSLPPSDVHAADLKPIQMVLPQKLPTSFHSSELQTLIIKAHTIVVTYKHASFTSKADFIHTLKVWGRGFGEDTFLKQDAPFLKAKAGCVQKSSVFYSLRNNSAFYSFSLAVPLQVTGLRFGERGVSV